MPDEALDNGGIETPETPDKPKRDGAIANAAWRLLVIALGAALALAATNMVTEEPIRQQTIAAATASRQAVMPEADAFELLETVPDGGLPDLLETYRAIRGGETVGYTFYLDPVGYKAEIPMTVGMDMDGVITGVSIGDIQETSGIGTKVKGEAFLAQFPGMPAAEADGIDTISGATISSSAVKRGVQQAAAAYQQFAGRSGEEAVKGEEAEEGGAE